MYQFLSLHIHWIKRSRQNLFMLCYVIKRLSRKCKAKEALSNLINHFTKIWLSIPFSLLQLHCKLNGFLNPFSANFTKWSNTLKQFVGNLLTNCLSVFDHFVGLVLKGLRHLSPCQKCWTNLGLGETSPYANDKKIPKILSKFIIASLPKWRPQN